jgi:hypothetical protein
MLLWNFHIIYVSYISSILVNITIVHQSDIELSLINLFI